VRKFVAEADRLAEKHGTRFKVPESLRRMAADGETFYGAAASAKNRSAA
jgi:3-hydroxyacyl-CoA dehydrogenase/enoyl-CoA hydratase/3-hydroxybutyryl-CoA epimerase